MFINTVSHNMAIYCCISNKYLCLLYKIKNWSGIYFNSLATYAANVLYNPQVGLGHHLPILSSCLKANIILLVFNHFTEDMTAQSTGRDLPTDANAVTNDPGATNNSTNEQNH